MIVFKIFNFMASLNNLSISAIVVVLSACSQDCSPSFWQLFESSPPEVSRPRRNTGPQCELDTLAILEVSPATVTSKCIEIAWREVRGIGWME